MAIGLFIFFFLALYNIYIKYLKEVRIMARDNRAFARANRNMNAIVNGINDLIH